MIGAICDFLNGIGLRTRNAPGANGFVTGILIQDGILLVDMEKAVASNLLHEAAHLAILPSKFRPFAEKSLHSVFKKMLDETDFSNPDSPEARAAIQCSDLEATAWGWAAGKHLGIPDKQIIRDKDYDNGGKDIRSMLSMKAYFGINGLRAGGMIASVRSFPQMLRWVQI